MKDTKVFYEWLDNDELKIWSIVPGIKTSTFGRKAFFNQLISLYTGNFDERNTKNNIKLV